MMLSAVPPRSPSLAFTDNLGRVAERGKYLSEDPYGERQSCAHRHETPSEEAHMHAMDAMFQGGQQIN